MHFPRSLYEITVCEWLFPKKTTTSDSVKMRVVLLCSLVFAKAMCFCFYDKAHLFSLVAKLVIFWQLCTGYHMNKQVVMNRSITNSAVCTLNSSNLSKNKHFSVWYLSFDHVSNLWHGYWWQFCLVVVCFMKRRFWLSHIPVARVFL